MPFLEAGSFCRSHFGHIRLASVTCGPLPALLFHRRSQVQSWFFIIGAIQAQNVCLSHQAEASPRGFRQVLTTCWGTECNYDTPNAVQSFNNYCNRRISLLILLEGRSPVGVYRVGVWVFDWLKPSRVGFMITTIAPRFTRRQMSTGDRVGNCISFSLTPINVYVRCMLPVNFRADLLLFRIE